MLVSVCYLHLIQICFRSFPSDPHHISISYIFKYLCLCVYFYSFPISHVSLILVSFILTSMPPSVDSLHLLSIFHFFFLSPNFGSHKGSIFRNGWKTWQLFASEPNNFACEFHFQLRSVSDKSGNLHRGNHSNPSTEALRCSPFLWNLVFFFFVSFIFNVFPLRFFLPITIRIPNWHGQKCKEGHLGFVIITWDATIMRRSVWSVCQWSCKKR